MTALVKRETHRVHMKWVGCLNHNLHMIQVKKLGDSPTQRPEAQHKIKIRLEVGVASL
jgi:hypothetical protein